MINGEGDFIKNKVEWTKGQDFIDNTPRYTFEGRDPSYTLERFRVVIYTDRKRKYSWDSKSVKNFYIGHVEDNERECGEETKELESIADCKKETLKLFNKYMTNHIARQKQGLK